MAKTSNQMNKNSGVVIKTGAGAGNAVLDYLDTSVMNVLITNR